MLRSRLGGEVVVEFVGLNGTQSHGAFEHRAHPRLLEHHLLPGEAQHAPSREDELVISPAVARQTASASVELVTVRLEHEAEADVDQVRDHPLPTSDQHSELGHHGQPGNVERDRSQTRLERVGCLAMGIGQDA